MKVKSESEVTQSCLTLCDPMDCSLPGSSVHGIFQARVLEWVAIAFSIAQFNPYQNSSGSFSGTRTNNWYRKRCSASLIIGEMPMRTTMRYHFTPARVSVIKKIRENMYGEDGEKSLAHYSECQFMQPLESTGGPSSKMEPLCDLVLLPLGSKGNENRILKR